MKHLDENFKHGALRFHDLRNPQMDWYNCTFYCEYLV